MRQRGPWAAALASGAMLHFVVGLTPWWPMAWVAPLPLLVACFSAESRLERLALSLLAAGIGYAGTFRYFATTAGGAPAGLIVIVLLSLEWSLATGLATAIVRRSPHWTAVFAYPLAWASLDVLVAATSPHSTFGSLAYSQLGASPATQVAAIGGTPAVVFLVCLPASVAAVAIHRNGSLPRAGFVVPALLAAAALGYGAWRLTRTPESTASVRMGMVSIDDQASSEAVWQGYARHVDALARQGARIVLLPEKIQKVDTAASTATRDALARMAALNHVYLVAGVGIAHGENLAWLFAPTGALEATYVKHHLVPGLEAEHIPGTAYTVQEIDGRRYGLAICKDMHFPSLGREYGRRAVDAMLVPAWDFGADAWVASRLTALRGVESGYPIVRSSREGLLTVTDSRGRVVADLASAPLPGVALLADVPVGRAGPTLYAQLGDWFGWLCVFLVVAQRATAGARPAGLGHARNSAA